MTKVAAGKESYRRIARIKPTLLKITSDYFYHLEALSLLAASLRRF